MDRLVVAVLLAAAVYYYNSNGRHFANTHVRPTPPMGGNHDIRRYRDEHSPFTPA